MRSAQPQEGEGRHRDCFFASVLRRSLQMYDTPSRFRQAMDGVRAGSPDAAWAIIEEYGPHIHRVVRRKLDRRIRSKFDSMDFVQMVWASFFRHPSEMASFHDPNQLAAYLMAMARNKLVSERRRRLQTAKYQVTRERSLASVDDRQPEFADENATPSQIATARERYDQLLSSQPRRHQRVIEMRLTGATFNEIAEKLRMHPNTARRVVSRLTALHACDDELSEGGDIEHEDRREASGRNGLIGNGDADEQHRNAD